MEKWVTIGVAANAVVANLKRKRMSKDWADEFVDWMIAEGSAIQDPELVAMRLRSIGCEREIYATKEAYEMIRKAFDNAHIDLGGGNK